MVLSQYYLASEVFRIVSRSTVMMQNQITNGATASEWAPTVHLRWHLITCEYPPQSGGVSDYTYGVAAGLAAKGDDVHVWCPGGRGAAPPDNGVVVHRSLGAITPEDLRQVGKQLDQFPGPRRFLVQWVPHGYGYQSMNLGFCRWLHNRAVRHGDRVEIMLHEPYLAFGRNLKQTGVAMVHRLMTILLLRAAEKVWVSIPEWEKRWRPYALGRPLLFQWLPIPSNIPLAAKPNTVEAMRHRYAPEGGLLIGHFGTYGWPITSLLTPILNSLVGDSVKRTVLLMGIGSEKFCEEAIRKQPRLDGLIRATGSLSAEDLSCHVAACDLLIQPYPDGVSSRRTSLMVGLSHGKPIITTIGPLSESFWKSTGALALGPVGDSEAFLQLLRTLGADHEERTRIGRAAQALYRERFDLSHIVSELRKVPLSDVHSTCVS